MWLPFCPMGWNLNHLTGDQSQSFMVAEFVAGIEHHLHPEADAEERISFLAEKLEWFDQIFEFESRHPVGKRPDTGKNKAVRIDDGFRLVGENELRATMFKGANDIQ